LDNEKKKRKKIILYLVNVKKRRSNSSHGNYHITTCDIRFNPHLLRAII